MWLSGFCLVLLLIALPETSSGNILYRRSRRLRKLTGNDKLVCEAEIASQDMGAADIAKMSLVRPFQLALCEPIVFCLNMYIALIYGLLYIWFESFPIVFTGIYGFSLGLEGLAFLGILVGVFVTVPPFVWYQMKYVEPKFNENGEIKPEYRLPPAFVGALAIPICLFWFGWTSRPEIHWIVPIIGTAWFSVGAFLLFNCVLNYLSDAYPEYAASVLAGNDFVRSCFGGAFVSQISPLSVLVTLLVADIDCVYSPCSRQQCIRISVSRGLVRLLDSFRLRSYRFLSCCINTGRRYVMRLRERGKIFER